MARNAQAPPTATKQTPALPPELAKVLDAVAALQDVVTTNGVVDLSVMVPSETVYRVADITGRVREYTVPDDLPFTLALELMQARDVYVKARDRLDQAKEAEQNRLLGAYSQAWTLLLEKFRAVLALRQPEVTARELEEVSQQMMLSFLGAVWLRLVGAWVRPFLDSDGGLPKGPSNRAERRRGARTAPKRRA